MISDLLALAQVRRTLLELGYRMQPDAAAGPDGGIGALEAWLHTPHAALDGATPMQALQGEGGHQRIQQLLELETGKGHEA